MDNQDNIYTQEDNFGRWRKDEFFEYQNQTEKIGYFLFFLLILYYVIQLLHHIIIRTK